MNNTEKLDDIRRRLRVIDTRLDILQRIGVIVFERVTSGRLPPTWVIHESEQNILADADVSDDRFWERLTTLYRQS